MKNSIGKNLFEAACAEDPEMSLRESEAHFRSVFESNIIGIFFGNKEGDTIVEANDAFLRIVGYDREDLRSGLLRFDRLTLPEQFHLTAKAIEEARIGGFCTPYEKDYIRKDGSRVPVIIGGASLKDSRYGGVGFVLDISERKKTEEALRERESKLRRIVDSNMTGIIFWNSDGAINEANDAFLNMIGYTREDLNNGLLNWQKITPPEFRAIDGTAAREFVDSGIFAPYEKEYIRKDGSRLSILLSGAKLEGSNTQGVSVVIDVGERKRAEEALRESEERFRHLFEQAADAVFVTAMNGKFIDVNQRACDSLGYSREELLSLFVPDIDKTIAFEQLAENRKRMSEGEFITHNGSHTRKDGTSFPVEVRTSLFESSGQNYVLSIVRDVTERNRAEEQIKSSLNEKEVLIKEIHHRVKNNLQIISSLLNIQSQYIKDNDALEMFKESQNRIRSMALIHEKLYQSKGFIGIDFRDYINSLTTQLFRAYKIDADLIKLKIDVEDVQLDVDTAIPCGLIINELVSNSIKHAFPKGNRGSISINMRPHDKESFLLTVSDDGIGLPENFDLSNSESLGLQLVSMLASQLSGKTEILSAGGAEFKVFFKMPNNKRGN